MANAETQQQEPLKQEDATTYGSVLDRTVSIGNLTTSVEKLAMILKPIYSKYGVNPDQALIRKREECEITFATVKAIRDCLEDEFQIENRRYDTVSLINSDLLVNLNTLPAYVYDEALVKKLQELGCTVVRDIYAILWNMSKQAKKKKMFEKTVRRLHLLQVL